MQALPACALGGVQLQVLLRNADRRKHLAGGERTLDMVGK